MNGAMKTALQLEREFNGAAFGHLQPPPPSEAEQRAWAELVAMGASLRRQAEARARRRRVPRPLGFDALLGRAYGYEGIDEWIRAKVRAELTGKVFDDQAWFMTFRADRADAAKARRAVKRRRRYVANREHELALHRDWREANRKYQAFRCREWREGRIA